MLQTELKSPRARKKKPRRPREAKSGGRGVSSEERANGATCAFPPQGFPASHTHTLIDTHKARPSGFARFCFPKVGSAETTKRRDQEEAQCP